jgi:signal transduction histidine kinase
VALLRDIGQGFALALRMARAAREERALREESERQSEERAALLTSLAERSRLLERLLRIQRSISHQAPPEEIFDAITAGASELLGLGIASLRLEDPEDPDTLVMISSFGIPPETVAAIRRAPRGRGASGRAFEQGRLVAVDEYHRSDDVHEAYVTDRLQAAMAAPVHERGRVVGSLTVASHEPGRRFSPMEQEALLAFAEHASLALADARTLADLRDAERARDMFLAGVSHELKTPLTVIMGALRTLERREPALSPEVRDRLLAAAFERGRDLERLIDRLLQGARAELASQRHRVRLPDLLERAVEGFEHGQRLVLGEVPDTEAVLDDSAVRSILGVLLENAASHGAPGSAVAVEVAVDDAEVRIAVQSEGSLPAELSERELFEPFRRGASATSSGVGLGLSIAARVAASAGGRMTAESADGKVVFTLRLPYEPGATPPDQRLDAPGTPPQS